MKYFPSILLFVAALLLLQWAYHDSDTRLRDQARLLASIESLHTPDTTSFVTRWQAAHKDPVESTVSDLTIIAAKLKSDPSQAKVLSASIQPDQTLADALRAAKSWASTKEGFSVLLMVGLTVGVGVIMHFALGSRS